MNDKLEIRKRISEQLKQIDDIAKPAMAIFDGANSVSEEIEVAFAMRDILEMLTPEVMAPIKALMNTSIGFKTDRDPSVWNNKLNKYNEPYPDETVKRCFAESRLRGLHVIGGEWAILVGSCFPCQPGLERKVKTLTSGSFEYSNDAPVFGPKQAVVRFRGKWKLKGESFDIGTRPEDSCEFSVNCYDGTMPAAVVGKGYRMLLARVLKRITGKNVVSDADVSGEAIEVEAKPVKTGPSFGLTGSNEPLPESKPATAPKLEVVTKPEPAPQSTPEPARTAFEEPVAAKMPAPTQERPGEATAEPQFGKKSLELEEAIVESKAKPDDFLAWLQATDRLPNATALSRIAEIPEALASNLILDSKSIGKFFKAYGKK